MDGTGLETTSFIPKKPMTPGVNLGASLFGIFIFASAIIFLASIGWYFYAKSQLVSVKDDIANIEVVINNFGGQFQPKELLNMTRLDAKLKLATDLLYLSHDIRVTDNYMHVTMVPLLNLISQKTLKSVRFKDFKYTNVDNSKIDIRMSGEARGASGSANYAAVAQQAREFSNSGGFKNVIVSDLNLGSNNNVIFNLTATVKPELVSYTEQILNEGIKQ